VVGRHASDADARAHIASETQPPAATPYAR
jgi:hypothetical protein